MRRTDAAENNRQPALGREAKGNASRPSPLALVSGAVAGADLPSVVATASEALGRPLAIAVPALGEPVVHPAGALAKPQMTEIAAYALAYVKGTASSAPRLVGDTVPIRIGEQLVGIAVDVRAPVHRTGGEMESAEERVWLEAAAAAASVTALMREVHEPPDAQAQAHLLAELFAAPVVNAGDLVARARRLGCDLASGASAICAHRHVADRSDAASVPRQDGSLVSDVGKGWVLGLVPDDVDVGTAAVAADMRSRGFTVAVSSARREPGALHEAMREARLLIQLTRTSGLEPGNDEDTYRLLIGVLLRDPDELRQLRNRSISPLAEYDLRHDTELLSTLQVFLAHDCSTSETADVMQLHRHTVGYRLARVHEVSGLSPYASDGRERLSLGLKADQILAASAECETGWMGLNERGSTG